MKILKIATLGLLLGVPNMCTPMAPLAPVAPITLDTDIFTGDEMEKLKKFCSDNLFVGSIKERLTKPVKDFAYQNPLKFGAGVGASLVLLGWNAERLIPAVAYLIPRLVDLGMGIWRFAMYKKIYGEIPTQVVEKATSSQVPTPLSLRDAIQHDFSFSDQRSYELVPRTFSLKGTVYSIGFLSIMYGVWYYLKIKPLRDFKVEIKNLEEVIKRYDSTIGSAKNIKTYLINKLGASVFNKLTSGELSSYSSDLSEKLTKILEEFTKINKNLSSQFAPFKNLSEADLGNDRMGSKLKAACDKLQVVIVKIKKEIDSLKSYVSNIKLSVGYRGSY